MEEKSDTFLHRVIGRVKVLSSKPLRNKETEESVTETISTSMSEAGAVVATDAPATPPPTPEVPPAPSETQPGGATSPDAEPEAAPEAPAEAPAPATGDGDAPTEPADAKDRRGRGVLEADVKTVCDQFVTGGFTLAEGDHLTAHKIAKKITEMRPGENPPSSGAVTAVLDRWHEVGYATLNPKPKAFSDYTDAGRSEGLTALKAKCSAEKRAARAAEKAALKAAEAAAAPDTIESSSSEAPPDPAPADNPPEAADNAAEDAPF